MTEFDGCMINYCEFTMIHYSYLAVNVKILQFSHSKITVEEFNYILSQKILEFHIKTGFTVKYYIVI
jgi:hypothetical protein